MPVACSPNRGWDWCVPEYEKKKKKRNRSNVYWGIIKFGLVVYKMGILKHLAYWGIETFKQIVNYNFMISWFKCFDLKLDIFYT